MPNPVIPSRAKALLPSVTGSTCERLRKIFQFIELFFEDVQYSVGENGLPTDEFKADFCASGCTGGDGGGSGEPPNPNMPAPEALTASDDAFSDKIRIDWEPPTVPSGIAAVTQYRLYRGTTTSFSSAALIATINAPTVVYDDPVDGDLSAGTTYYYWVRATNGTDTSAPSNRDQGRAASSGEIGVLDDITDLRVSYGLGSISAALALDWTPPAGATKFDIYRHTANDFSAATKIYSDVVPRATTFFSHDTHNPEAWNNVERCVLYDTPPSNATDYYYFIVAKADSPPRQSAESNAGLGRVLPPAIYNLSSEVLDFSNQSTVVPVGASKAWLVLQGSGGGGAGGGILYGGPGGGGGGMVRVELTGLTPGHTVELATLTVNDSGNAPSETNGTDGEALELSINSILTAIANPGLGGIYDASGAGDGGEGGDAGASVGSPVVYNGAAGLPNDGANGGRSGYLFGGRRMPMANPEGVYNGDGFVGSGAKAIPYNPTISVGGKALTGRAIITFGT